MKVKRKDQSFLIAIKNTQNATWQGVISWVDEDKKETFRSTLELLKLLDSAIVYNDEDEQGFQKDE